MGDMDRLEALVGPLPKGRAYEKRQYPKRHPGGLYCDIFNLTDDALVEAYVVIKRLAGMLDHIDRIVGDVPRTGDADSAVMDIARVFSDAALAGRDRNGGGA